MVNFYNDVNESTNSNGELPLIPIAFQDSSELLVRTISTGNEIIESVHLTKWLQKRRTAFADQLDRYEKKWETNTANFRLQVQHIINYSRKNIFNDEFENKHTVVPGSLIALGAFFAGSLAVNKSNWGAKRLLFSHKSSILEKLCTSLPSRMLLPWVLAAATFKFWAPQTSQNLVSATENDLLPRDFVSSYHDAWKQLYEEGYVAKKNTLKCHIDQTLQKNIKYAREQLYEKLEQA
ncbi:Mic27p [Saccharomyces eubayanus]|uniref:Mic27p n=1 Tax=Saccharomyces eubayanus TaxID=1080349 RepID=UPI0006C61804|nr:AIM37-like protein [Saccharomyces eubayanus]KOG97058.1 AIM37-like protein [Saccharomyces eubayanus]